MTPTSEKLTTDQLIHVQMFQTKLQPQLFVPCLGAMKNVNSVCWLKYAFVQVQVHAGILQPSICFDHNNLQTQGYCVF